MGSANRPKPIKLPEKLLSIREYFGYTGLQIAEELSDDEVMVRRTDIPRYEKGIREPSLMILLRYARLANISTDVLIDDKMELPKKYFVYNKKTF